MRIAAICLAMSFLVATTFAQVPDEPTTDARLASVRQAVLANAPEKHWLLGEVSSGVATSLSSPRMDLSIDPSVKNTVIATCDLRCASVSFWVIDNQGDSILEGGDGSALARGVIPTGRARKVIIRLSVKCLADPCAWAAGVFAPD